MVGGVVGTLAERDWAQQRRPWVNILLAWIGIACLAGGHLLIGAWLGIYQAEQFDGLWRPVLLSGSLGAVGVGALEVMRDLIERPLPRIVRREPIPENRAVEPSSGLPFQSLPADTASKPSDEEDAGDLIMLELD